MRGPLAERSEVKTVKRISFVLLAAFVLVLAASGTAYANFGPHGGYSQDTDGCAGCHRAHTSFSDLGWTDLQGEERASALLISNASQMTDFCYACHGNSAPGASTNVQYGIYDSGPTGSTTHTANFYASNSKYGATLNGGGFERLGADASETVMSAHDMQGTGSKVGSATVWGYIPPTTGASSQAVLGAFKCTSCHDPHGSSNYRLLKDIVNGAVVGGYTASGTPQPFVISNEQGYPTGGFRKGQTGEDDVAGYVPNYTTPQYAQLSGRAMSGWCAGCHVAYGSQDSSYTYTTGMEVVNASTGTSEPLGEKGFHRHPVDVSLSLGMAPDDDRALNVQTLNDDGLPLEMTLGNRNPAYTDAGTEPFWTADGNISCLTCHYAHGSAATMDGWAVAQLVESSQGPTPSRFVASSSITTQHADRENPLGVNPNFSQALLRYDNRGVCERCHNK
jgi:hypothetical protein